MRGTVWCEPCNPYLLLVSNQWDAGIMLRQEAIEKYNLYYDKQGDVTATKIGSSISGLPDRETDFVLSYRTLSISHSR